MKKVYIDTSVLLRHVFAQPKAFRDFRKQGSLYTSQLTIVEAHRAIDRYRIMHIWESWEVAERIRTLSASLDAFEIIPLQPAILQRASESFATVVKTLDALHLATALLLQSQTAESILFLTHDTQQGIAATTMGFSVMGTNAE